MINKIVIPVVAILVVVLGYYIVNPPYAKAIIHGHTFLLELAVTPEQKQKGLGYRDSLALNHAMLFPYDHKELYGFWMKGMRFPLDFLWIDGNTIVDITKNVPAPNANEQPISLQPKLPVDKILELNAGTVDEIGATIGDTVVFKTN